MREPNTLPAPAGDAGLLFRLVYKPHRPSSRIGTVVEEVTGPPTEIGPVFYNREKAQYWGIVHTTDDTQLRNEPQQVLEDMVRLHLLGPLWQHHPTVAAAYGRTDQLRNDWQEKHDRAALTHPNPDHVHAVIEARGEYQGALSTLAYILTAAGVNVAGYGGLPTGDLALAYLDRWIEAQKPKG